MKKLTLTAIRDYLKTLPVDTSFDNPAYDGAPTTRKAFPITEVITELDAELNRGAEAKAVKTAEYDAARAAVMAELASSETPVTISELFEAVKDKLPSGFTKGKLQYGITQLWTSELVKTEGKVNTYAKA